MIRTSCNAPKKLKNICKYCGKEMATLLCNNNQEIKVPGFFVVQCQTLKDLVNDLGDSTIPVPVLQVEVETITKLLEYCEKHKVEYGPNGDYKEIAKADMTDHDREVEKELKDWDDKWADFKTDEELVDQQKYIKYACASNYLGNSKLTKLLGQKMIKHIRGKTPEEIRDACGICQTCRLLECLQPQEVEEMQRFKESAVNDNFTNVRVKTTQRCKSCENCLVTKCQHGKLFIPFTPEQEKKIREIKSYEDWKKEMDAQQQKTSSTTTVASTE